MRRLLLCLLALCCLVPAFCQKISHSGQLWQLENKCLKVSVDAQAGTFTVLDKQAGYLWRAPDRNAQQSLTLLVPQATAAPKIDADLSEWVDRGALFELLPAMLSEGAKPESAADGSARVRVLWDAGALYLAADVRDSTFVPSAADTARWWDRDSIELWLGDTQYAMRFGPWGCNFWSSTGAVRDARGAFRRTDNGYQLEMALPAALVGGAKLGSGFRFAFGLNDCDETSGARQSQLYYPTGWAHSNSETFSRAVLANDQGSAAAEKPELRPALEPSPRPVKPGRMEFSATLRNSGKPLPGFVSFALLGEGPDLQITLDTADPKQEVGRVSALNPLGLDHPGRILAAAYNDGIGVPTDDMTWRGRTWSTYGSLDMPWVGLTDGKLGYILLYELPLTCDNGVVSLDVAQINGRPLLAPAVSHDPACKQFAGPRVVRYSFVADGGHVALCKRFREYIKGQGLLVTQREKLRNKPQLARLLGAPDVWGRSDLKFMSEARAAGIDRMLVNAPQPKADMEKIKAMGFLMGLYDNYEDAFEGDKGAYGDFVEADDVVILANGERMKAWLTKGDKPKQFMKRCASLFEKVARTWVPRDLEKYPYNARFIDVTTATGLAECYHPRHPHDRTQDREVKRRLAKYMSDELKLVLGGEHGRWWGADLYNYWEGMQSGGFYSWPAGYVGAEMPKTRADVSEKYQTWGLGETNRYPLWELVYHDCVTSTWYWGDSTGHLLETMPELGYKQDAFNVLYGTVPLYWVTRPFSYNWGKPELRARLLESYRNTCKLHEQVGFDEMRFHEFVTPDRRVQHTSFGDGTNVWVNFGEQPWTLQLQGKRYVLPQYGFYAKGPKLEQYRVLRPLVAGAAAPAWSPALRGTMAPPPAGQREITFIRSEGYLFADADIPGVISAQVEGQAATDGQTCRVEGPGRIRLNFAPGTKRLKLNVAALCPGSAKSTWRIVELDQDGVARSLGKSPRAEGNLLVIEPGSLQSMVLVGAEALAGHAEIEVGEPRLTPAAPRQGQPLALAVPVANLGGKPATNLALTLRLGSQKLLTKPLSVPAAAGAEAVLELDTATWDGPLTLTVEVPPAAGELCSADNRRIAEVFIKPDLATWQDHWQARVTVPAGVSAAPIVRLPLAAAGLPGTPTAVLATVEGAEEAYCPTQLLATQRGPELLWRLPARGAPEPYTVTCRIYTDSRPQKHFRPPSGRFDTTTSTFTAPAYAVQFVEGYIKGVWVTAPPAKVLSSLGASSQDTGWVDEDGTVESFEVVNDGPVCTQIRVKKKLNGNHFYDKLYTFYDDRFAVTVLNSDRFGTMNRSYYLLDGTYLDDKGVTAKVDGAGDAEGVSGVDKNPLWYLIHGRDYVVVNAAVTPYSSIGYWDAGNKAGVGFSGPSGKDPETVMYFVSNLRPGRPFEAAAFGKAVYQELTGKPVVEGPPWGK